MASTSRFLKTDMVRVAVNTCNLNDNKILVVKLEISGLATMAITGMRWYWLSCAGAGLVHCQVMQHFALGSVYVMEMLPFFAQISLGA
jgi:hypothetical protein